MEKLKIIFGKVFPNMISTVSNKAFKQLIESLTKGTLTGLQKAYLV